MKLLATEVAGLHAHAPRSISRSASGHVPTPPYAMAAGSTAPALGRGVCARRVHGSLAREAVAMPDRAGCVASRPHLVRARAWAPWPRVAHARATIDCVMSGSPCPRSEAGSGRHASGPLHTQAPLLPRATRPRRRCRAPGIHARAGYPGQRAEPAQPGMPRTRAAGGLARAAGGPRPRRRGGRTRVRRGWGRPSRAVSARQAGTALPEECSRTSRLARGAAPKPRGRGSRTPWRGWRCAAARPYATLRPRQDCRGRRARADGRGRRARMPPGSRSHRRGCTLRWPRPRRVPCWSL